MIRPDLSNGAFGDISPVKSMRFCCQFEAENGGTACAAILREKLGRDFDLADRKQALEYARQGGPEACSKVVASAITIALKVLK